jgi:tight adherence protein C
MDPALIKIIACSLFGLAAFLFVFWLYRLSATVQKGSSTYTGTSGRRAEMRDLALRNSALFRLVVPWLQALGNAVDRLGFNSLKTYVHDPYVRAGYPGGLEDGEVVGLGFLLSLVFTAFVAFSVLVLLPPIWLPLALLGMPMGLLMLVSSLKTRAAIREIEILKGLPYLLDLITLMLRSGTSLRLALVRVVNDYEGHPIGVEFGQVLAEIDMGATRIDAFKKLADRLKISDISQLTDAILQSEELGWPLAETLERLADRIQNERMLKAQATAGAAGVYVMIPSTLVLISSVLLLFSPLIVSYLRKGVDLQ